MHTAKKRNETGLLDEGQVLYEGEKYKEAIQKYSESIEANKDFARAYFSRGVAYRHLKKFQESLRDLSKAIELGEDYLLNSSTRSSCQHLKRELLASASHERGLVCLELKKNSQAIGDFGKSISIKETARVYFDRGMLFKTMGQYALSIQDLLKAAKLNKDDRLVSQALKDVYQLQFVQQYFRVKAPILLEGTNDKGVCYLLKSSLSGGKKIKLYEGGFRNGKFHGKGIVYDQKSYWALELYRGTWKDGYLTVFAEGLDQVRDMFRVKNEELQVVRRVGSDKMKVEFEKKEKIIQDQERELNRVTLISKESLEKLERLDEKLERFAKLRIEENIEKMVQRRSIWTCAALTILAIILGVWFSYRKVPVVVPLSSLESDSSMSIDISTDISTQLFHVGVFNENQIYVDEFVEFMASLNQGLLSESFIFEEVTPRDYDFVGVVFVSEVGSEKKLSEQFCNLKRNFEGLATKKNTFFFAISQNKLTGIMDFQNGFVDFELCGSENEEFAFHLSLSGDDDKTRVAIFEAANKSELKKEIFKRWWIQTPSFSKLLTELMETSTSQ